LNILNTKIASAVIIALAATGSAMANEASATKIDTFVLKADIVIQDAGNVIAINQEAPVGEVYGNYTYVIQDGDLNLALVDIVGDANEVAISQYGLSNIAVATVMGNDNYVDVLQDGIGAISDTTIIGASNYVSVQQIGGPSLFDIENRALNVIQGDSNTISIASNGSGGHWANNNIVGFGNNIYVQQFDEWNEAYVNLIDGDRNDVEFYQDGFYNIFNVTEVTGNDNFIGISVVGDNSRISFAVVGSENDITLQQVGNDNAVSFGVFEGDGETVFVEQYGEGNSASVDTLFSEFNTYSIYQDGVGNTGYTGTLGMFNTLLVQQSGDFNDASTVNFNGSVNYVDVTQIGNENLGLAEAVIEAGEAANGNGVMLSQEGNQNDGAITLATSGESNNNIIMAEQYGELNLLDLVVNGSDNFVQIIQEGSGNWVTAEDGGTFMMTASSTSFMVTQFGNENLVTGSISGTSGEISISQTGDYNVAVVNQM
jgi:hypothetical protein